MYIIKRSNRRKEEDVKRYIKEITELSKAGLTRRDLLKLGLVATGSGLLALHGCGSSDVPSLSEESAKSTIITSPPTQEFVEPLYIPPALIPVTLNPLPTKGQNTAKASNGFREARHFPHQRWTQFGGLSDTAPGFIGKMYETKITQIPYSFGKLTDGSPMNSHIWTFVEISTGKIAPIRINARYGEPVIHRVHNDLPRKAPFVGGFGINQITTHLHNGHVASESDGGPINIYGPCRYKDYHYPNVRAGFASNFPFTSLSSRGNGDNGGIANDTSVMGDVLETISFQWFHDHRFDFTAQNVYKGMASFYTLFSDDISLDTGDETTGLRLPSGDYDIPLIFTDPAFSSDGELFFDLFNLNGMLGDKEAVNLKIQPYLEVQPRRYRFRMLGGGPSRWREFYLTNPNGSIAGNFILLSNDGNLLPRALAKKSVRISVAERFDVIVDFTGLKQGQIIYLENRLEQTDGRGPTGKILNPGKRVLQFRVVPLKNTDNSKAYKGGEPLLALPPMLPVQRTRDFHFDSSGGGWVINGKFFDPDVIDEFLPQDAIENWHLTTGKGWAHPVHMHQEEFRILNRNGNPPPDYEIARKDVIDIGENVNSSGGTGDTTFYSQHRDFHGHYPFHCHNTVHEDHAMMLLFQIGDPTTKDEDIDPIC